LSTIEDSTESAGTGAASPWLAASLLLLAAIGALASLWRVDYLPTHDGPQHVFLGHLANHFGDAGAGYDRYLTRGEPWTALGFHALFSVLERLAPWRTALRLALSVIVLAWGAGHAALAASLHRRRAALGLVGFATAISWPLYMGFFSYALSIALAFVTLAVAARGFPWTVKQRAAIAALLTAQAIAHAFGAEVAGAVLLATVLLAPGLSSQDRAKEAGLLALMGAPAAALALTAAGSDTSSTTWLSFPEQLWVLPRAFVPGPLWRAWVPLALAIAGIALAARRAREASAIERGIMAASALFLALGFLAPLHLPSWEFFSPRFLPAGCLLGVALLPIEKLDKKRALAALGSLAILAGASLAWAIGTNASLRARADEALSGLSEPVRRTGPRLAVVFDPSAGVTPDRRSDGRAQEIPFYAPLFNLGAIYAVEQGGIPPYIFATNPKIHSFVLSAEGRKRFPELYDLNDLAEPKLAHDPLFRRGYVTFLAAVGAGFEDVVLYGRPEDGDVLVERGYEADVRRGGLFMGRFVGCPSTIEITTPAPRKAAAFVELGFDPMPQALDRAVLPPEKGQEAPAGATTTARYRPKIPLCGPAWLRVTLDVDLSGSPSPGDRFCEGADPKGRVRVDIQRNQAIGCRIAP
jgi:hypothetical protein